MATASTADWKFLGLNMWQQVVVGLILGIASGFLLGQQAASLAIFGTVFIKLIKMVVSPLIFFALISGITSLTGGHSFKGMAFKGTFAYLATSLCAVCLGLAMGHFFTPGIGIAPPASGMAAVPALAAPPPGIGACHGG
jgi:Na+/H+-dicarboxylate symporter